MALEDTLTPAERNLVRMGEHQRLRDMRMFFQYATVREFCEPVERITGRRVRSFIRGIDTEVDGLSLETFVLHPEGSPAPSRAERRSPERRDHGRDKPAESARSLAAVGPRAIDSL